MAKYKRFIKANGWYVCYFLKDSKVINVTFSAKDGKLAGWCQRMLFWEAS